MIKPIKLLIYLALFSLNGCLWNSDKDLALQAVKQKIEDQLLTESRDTLESKPIFHKRFVSIISGKTEISLASETESGEITTFVVNVKTISEYGRYNLKEVFAKQNELRDTNFNGADALSMILKTAQKESDRYLNQVYTVKINTEKNSKIISIIKNQSNTKE